MTDDYNPYRPPRASLVDPAWPGGGELPREYSHTLDPFVGLAVAAAVTTRLRVGTGICLLTERDPIITAKAVATLDHLSNGRVVFGIAGGWIKEAMEHHGSPFRERWRIVRDLTTNQARREASVDVYPPTTQIWRVGTGGPPPEGYVPEGDGHPEYTADEYTTMTQGPGIRGTDTTRQPGFSGLPGWTARMGMPQPPAVEPTEEGGN